LAVAQERSKYANKTADISSINDLVYKPPITLDPKIRKALLNVLNRLEEQDNKKTSTDSKLTKKEKNNDYFLASSTSTAKPSRVEDTAWEYKSYNPSAFKKYDYYINVATSRSTGDELKSNKNENGDGKSERGALFFQIPEKGRASQVPNDHSDLSALSTSSPKSSVPGSDILFANLQNEINEQYLVEPISTATSSNPVNTTEDATKSINEGEGVEFFKAPLLTAFTLEQDEQGLPRRIIPLVVPEVEVQAILGNRINQDAWENRRVRDQGKDVAVAGGTASHFSKSDLQAQENVVPLSPFLRLELESQYQQLQERKRQIEFEKERLIAEQEKARRLKLALEWQQKQQEYARASSRNEIVKSDISFQKSVEPQVRMLVPVPTVVPALLPMQAFNLGEFAWQQPVQNFQAAPAVLQSAQHYVNFPRIVDNQLQKLFQQSGLNPRGQQEDLNIVSKVLALNHEPNDISRLSPKRTDTIRNETSLTDVRAEKRTASLLGERWSTNISSPSANFDSNSRDLIL